MAFYSSSNDFTRGDLEPLDNDIKRTVRHYIRIAILMMLACESVYDIRSLNGGLLLVYPSRAIVKTCVLGSERPRARLACYLLAFLALSTAAMAAQADRQTTSRILAFLDTLSTAKAEWGISHMLLAQAVLRRPILLAQPIKSRPYWRMEPISDIVGRCVSAAGFALSARMLQTPSGEPLRLLLTRMNEVRVPLASISHWDPLLPVSDEQMLEDVHEYARLQSEEALDREKSRADWPAMLQGDASIYGGKGQKDVFLIAEFEAMEKRS